MIAISTVIVFVFAIADGRGVIGAIGLSAFWLGAIILSVIAEKAAKK